MDCSTWAKNFAEANQAEVLHLKPKNGAPSTGYLPGEVPPQGNYAYHSVAVKDGMVFDELNPNGIPIEAWKQEFMRLNNWTEAEFNHYYDLDIVPPPGAITK
jgi:hypothetical protein